MTADNPLVRAHHICPLCGQLKDPKLKIVACWPCYRKHDLRNGNDQADDTIADAERHLARVAAMGA